MQQILSYMRRAITEYEMIRSEDRIAVGVSGGKDSVALLAGLIRLREFLGIPFSLVAITLDPQFGGTSTDYSQLQDLCEEKNIPYVIKRSDLWEIIFKIRKEKNPCSLCARMRRGALHDLALEQGCNKIALGHNYDDVVETVLMNLFREGRWGCFSPVSYLSRKDLHMIRPLIYASEKEIERAVRREGFPVVKSCCPVDGETQRQKTKEFLKQMERENGGVTKCVFGALQRSGVDGWERIHVGRTRNGEKQQDDI